MFETRPIQTAVIINYYHLVTTTITQDEENQQTYTGNWIESSVFLYLKKKIKNAETTIYMRHGPP